ncbi:hypothetical protein [Lentzea sp. NBRC 102530]|uniref:hypothetical protein n=1 Tax=Lentzea sp. NBRC 102530 TaxID=3032201 RepID=UPI0024A598FE|nr:hypothetical protein [Lentzea sp. NBRC 102530]GLY47502.1 hypothetical protein Lesp01_11580 [Lentzea sp. NBRC 102530]
MKRRSAIAGLLGALVLASAVATPQAAAAACRYVRQDLPLPAGVTSAETRGSSTDNSRIVGSYANRGLVWTNSALRVMAPPASPSGTVRPSAVTNTGVVAGTQEIPLGGGGYDSRAFRYENNAYQLLAVEPGEQSAGHAINDGGDVLGVVWQTATPATRTVVMWPRTGPRRSFGAGEAVGIDAQRRILMSAPSPGQAGWIVDGNTGVKTTLPDARTPMVLDNGRVLHFEFGPAGTRIVELGLTGTRLATHDGGVNVFGRNNSGTVFGTYGIPQPSLWRPSGRTDALLDKTFDPRFHADVTDAATLIGTYREADDSTHPARWVWICS